MLFSLSRQTCNVEVQIAFIFSNILIDQWLILNIILTCYAILNGNHCHCVCNKIVSCLIGDSCDSFIISYNIIVLIILYYSELWTEFNFWLR